MNGFAFQTFRLTIVLIAIATFASLSEAGPILKRIREQRQQHGQQAPAYQETNYSKSVTTPAGSSVVTASSVTVNSSPDDALAEVNAKRAARGLRPLIHDPLLTEGARRVAAFRANHLLFGHSGNDFSFLPLGARASSAGCAAYQASYGWMSCCTYENYTYGGAAYVVGRDGKRYMHLFVR